MQLATRCPYCQTTFRVVQDQLKICNGIVRCGACRQVFNGIEQLQSADAALRTQQAQAEAGAAWPENADINPVTIVAQEEGDENRFTEANDDLKLNLMPADDPDGAAPTPLAETPDPVFIEASEPQSSPVTEEEPRPDLMLHADGLQVDESRREPQLDPHPGAAPAAQEPKFSAEQPAPGASVMAVEEADDPAYTVRLQSKAAEPGFVVRARQQERVGRVGRIVMAVLVIGLLPALLLQLTDAFHQRIGGTFPVLKPALEQACEVLECKSDLPMHIDAVSVESSELQAPSGNESAFTLNLVLRNRSPMAQAWPYVELTLNDANDNALVRRVFTADEYLKAPQDPAKGFASKSEHSIKLVFNVEQPKPVGYRVYLFYP